MRTTNVGAYCIWFYSALPRSHILRTDSGSPPSPTHEPPAPLPSNQLRITVPVLRLKVPIPEHHLSLIQNTESPPMRRGIKVSACSFPNTHTHLFATQSPQHTDRTRTMTATTVSCRLVPRTGIHARHTSLTPDHACQRQLRQFVVSLRLKLRLRVSAPIWSSSSRFTFTCDVESGS